MNPIDAAALRLQQAANQADERDRCDARAADLRLILRELARLQEWVLLETGDALPPYVARD